MACDIQPKCCQQSVSWLLVMNTWPWFKKWAVTIKILTRFRKILLFENAICYLQWALKTHTPIHFIVIRSTKPQPKKKRRKKKKHPWHTSTDVQLQIWFKWYDTMRPVIFYIVLLFHAFIHWPTKSQIRRYLQVHWIIEIFQQERLAKNKKRTIKIE